MGFPKDDTAEKWLNDPAQTFFTICFVSHNPADHIDPSDQGLVLGAYELESARVSLETDDVIGPDHLTDPRMRHPDKRFRWPIGLRARRAWKFKPRAPLTRETLANARAKGFDVSTDLIKIDWEDFSRLDHDRFQLEEVPVYGHEFRPQRLTDPNAAPSNIYVFACEKLEMLRRLPGWTDGSILVKIGCTSDVVGRLKSFNDHPLSRVTGLQLGRVVDRDVGHVDARREEGQLLKLAASLGRCASEIASEFFFIPKASLSFLVIKVGSTRRVG